mmetsp:Transcript_104409/g.264973  ORF Transcript_104409/g.264973 Transcript_104409/m.264973 type:complete len:677 (+) Transcript_104409:423-2453(+)
MALSTTLQSRELPSFFRKQGFDHLVGVGVLGNQSRSTIRLPLPRIVVPLAPALVDECPHRVALQLFPALQEGRGGRGLRQAGAHAAHQHARGVGVARVDDEGRPVLVLLGLVSRQHPALRDGLEVLRVPEEIGRLLDPAADPGREAGASEVLGVHADGLGAEEAPEVAVDPIALHLLATHQSVHLPSAAEAEQLQQNPDLQLLPALEVDGPMAQALHAVFENLQQTHGDREEIHVANAESSLLCDRHHCSGLVREDGVVVPRVEWRQLVHRFCTSHVQRPRDPLLRLVDEPRRHARASQIPPAADHPDLPGPILAAGPDVLHREGAVAHQRHLFASDHRVVNGVRDRIGDEAAELIFARVLFFLRHRQVAGEVTEARVLNLRLPTRLQVFERKPVGLIDIPLVGRPLPRIGLFNGDRGDVRLETAIRDDAVLLRDFSKVPEKFSPVRPRRHVLGHRVVLVVLQVVGAELGLKLRGGVGGVPPRGAPDVVAAVVEHEVRLAVLEEPHGLPQPRVAGADDRNGVLPDLPRAPEAGDALHADLPCNLIRVVLPPNKAALLRQERQGRGIDAKPLGKQLLDLDDLRAAHNGHLEGLIRAKHRELGDRTAQAARLLRQIRHNLVAQLLPRASVVEPLPREERAQVDDDLCRHGGRHRSTEGNLYLPWWGPSLQAEYRAKMA